MRELRPHLNEEVEFVERVQRQRIGGYHLAYLEAAGEIRALAGYRLWEKLTVGPHMFVDDLVTRAVDHSKGFGQTLFDWLVARAQGAGCVTLELDSGTQPSWSTPILPVQTHGHHQPPFRVEAVERYLPSADLLNR